MQVRPLGCVSQRNVAPGGEIEPEYGNPSRRLHDRSVVEHNAAPDIVGIEVGLRAVTHRWAGFAGPARALCGNAGQDQKDNEGYCSSSLRQLQDGHQMQLCCVQIPHLVSSVCDLRLFSVLKCVRTRFPSTLSLASA